ncbi:trace amine-associated receptor 1-like [Periophthalmus magnuspinnatus]|uniref:trace amine-associated receptor 1-like n=1 Tax=Periophthalmus magnuspinnatus TaxID=409849 RepID=UPI00145B9870|nr:trace amine-associated receptor 1-like [Periophthalmus magnuspinnatus]
MDTLELEFCFPTLNNSCKKTLHSEPQATLIYSVLSTITVLTVVLNLLVIISIFHFRQLHTCTNLLLLSLAFSDFLVGSIQMPCQIFHYRGCWFLGDITCVVYYFSGFLAVSASVGNVVLISIDRYVAICDPLSYPAKVTVTRIKACIGLCWIFSIVHASWILRDMFKQPDVYNSCIGECMLAVNHAEGTVDIVATFIIPFTLITVLYLRVFSVAVSQARAVRSHIGTIALQRSGAMAKKSELKAAKTLGVLVTVFLFCSCPYYAFSVAGESNQIGASSGGVQLWLIYFNSCANPLIYTFSYSWFRRCIKRIVTLQILQPDSRQSNVL